MKIGQLYDLASYTAFKDSAKRKGFSDSYAGAVLARNLTAVDPKILEQKYPELAFISSGIEADNSGGYATTIETLRLTELGGFSDGSDRNGGKGIISLKGDTGLLSVREREAQSNWTETEVRRADSQGLNLVSRYLQAHNKAYLTEVDEIGYLGIPTIASSTGLLNHAGFTTVAATAAAGAATAQNLYDDIAGLITDQHNGVNNTVEYKANRVDMPSYVLNTLAVAILNSAAGPSSVLSALKANFPGVEFRSTFRADNAGGVGVSHTVAYCNSGDSMKMRIPTPLTIGEIIKKGSFDHQVDSMYRVAGLDVFENASGHILTGL